VAGRDAKGLPASVVNVEPVRYRAGGELARDAMRAAVYRVRDAWQAHGY
jgi:hypothetical protein